MIRFLQVAMVLTTGLVCFWLYQTKEETYRAKQIIAGLNKTIAQENEAINLLKAEWSYLNQPSRLQALAEKHLDLKPLDPKQIKNFADLPERIPDPLPLDRAGLDGLANTALDSELHVGSVPVSDAQADVPALDRSGLDGLALEAVSEGRTRGPEND